MLYNGDTGDFICKYGKRDEGDQILQEAKGAKVMSILLLLPTEHPVTPSLESLGRR